MDGRAQLTCLYTNTPATGTNLNGSTIGVNLEGGGERYNYPKWVWSPTGGWWPHPRAWKPNTTAALVWVVALAVPIFVFSCRSLPSLI